MENLSINWNFDSKLSFDLGSVFGNEKLNLVVSFRLLPSRDCIISAVGTKADGSVIHLNGLSSKFENNTDLFLKNEQMSILANLQTDEDNNIIGGQSSGFVVNGGWTGYWWTENVTTF
ncbi:MAG: hypothetical protein AAFQ94_31425 [Bacteroidota bacterium]